jgi:hypothetical protein
MHGYKQRGNQPKQLLNRAATENIHVHVHHVTNDAHHETESKRGQQTVMEIPTLPRSAQSREQEGQKRQQTSDSCFGQDQKILVVNCVEETVTELGGQVAAHDDGEIVGSYSQDGVVLENSEGQIH